MSKQDGECIDHIGHDKCGSSDGLAVYEKPDGKIDGYCWVCQTYEPDPYKQGEGKQMSSKPKKTDAERQAELVEVYQGYAPAAIPERGITAGTAEYFGVRVARDPATQAVTHHFYPFTTKTDELVAYKQRRCADKQFVSMGFSKHPDLTMFGRYQAMRCGGKKLFVVGGEIDVLSAYQMLMQLQQGTEWANMRPAVVCARNGEGSTAKELSDDPDLLNRFQEIIVALDQDDAGRAAAEEVARLFPQKVRLVRLPKKDPNEMLQAGQLQEFKREMLFNAKEYKPATLVTIADVMEEAAKPVQWGIPFPWPTLTNLTYGIHPGLLIGVAAGVGCGKTTFWHQLEQHLICYKEPQRIGVFMLEEAPVKTAKKLAGKFLNVDVTKPDAQYDQAALTDILKRLDPYIMLFKHQEDRTWATVKENIRHMVLVEGIKHIILDPISALTYHLTATETNDALNQIFGEVSAMAETLGFTFYYSSHLNPPDTGKPHEEGGRVRLAQLTGSRAMIKWSHLILALERDTQAASLAEKNKVDCRVLKHREHGTTMVFPIIYNPDTGQFLEPVAYRPAGVTY